MNYESKVAELQADVQTIWKLQCQNLYNSKNLGALAVRECIQNSVDALKTAIKKGQIEDYQAKICIDFCDTEVTIYDNGCGMNIKTIHEKFLKLGGTTKGDEDNVGGFGLAKAVILGCGTGFTVHTQDNFLSSQDLGKRAIQKTTYLQGTKIVLTNVQISKDKQVKDDLTLFKNSILEYICSSELSFPVYVNGTLCNTWFERTSKSYRSPASFNISSDMIPDNTKLRINVHKEDTLNSRYLFVRLRGLTQFKQYLGWNANCNITIDFNTKTDPRSVDYPFSTNREGLKAQFQGILEAIRDKVTQSPLSISANEDFKETLYENANNSVEKERKICSSIGNLETKKILDTVSSIVEGIQPQGGYSQPSLADRAKQYQQQVEYLAQQEGVTSEEFVKTMGVKTVKKLDNPLEHSWIIWEDKAYTGKRINKSKSVDLIILWDAILRVMSSKCTNLDGHVFYPGIVVKEDTLGMCVEKNLPNGQQRCYILFNPLKVNVEDETQLALYLMGVAAHELAHLVCGSYEAHGETFSYTREAIMNQSLCVVSEVVKIVKMGKLKAKVKRLVKTPSLSAGTDFKGKSIEELIVMAQNNGINSEELKAKYSDPSIFRMRLIMCLKDAV